MAKTTAELMMEAETLVSYGAVPDRILDDALPNMSWQMSREEFLFRGIGDHLFHYRRGKGITVHRGADADAAHEFLWLNGSVYAAIASMNGLLPIHASAVAAGGSVFAFSGPTGSGKSTLVAALGNRGFRLFCDDTLVLDLSDPDRIMCLPGHKRLKLTSDALDLAAITPQERVSPELDKFYAVPASGEAGVSLSLAEVIFLEEGPDPSITPLSGSERLMRFQDDHYTAQLFATARQFDRAGMFTHLSNMAQRISMSRFVRPMDRSRFNESVEIAARHVENDAD